MSRLLRGRYDRGNLTLIKLLPRFLATLEEGMKKIWVLRITLILTLTGSILMFIYNNYGLVVHELRMENNTENFHKSVQIIQLEKDEKIRNEMIDAIKKMNNESSVFIDQNIFYLSHYNKLFIGIIFILISIILFLTFKL
jgi:hypothetical protein